MSSKNDYLKNDTFVVDSPSFVENYPSHVVSSSPFSSLEWLRLFIISKKYVAVHVTVWDGKKCILVQPLLICNFMPSLPHSFGSYCVAPCMPAFVDKIDDVDRVSAFKLLLDYLSQQLQRKVLYTEFRHFSIDNMFHQCFRNVNFNSLNWCNVKCDISDEKLDVNISKSKRKQIRRTFNSGAMVVFSPSESMIEQYYNIQKRLYDKIRRPLPELPVFKSLATSLLGLVSVILVDNNVVGGCSCFIQDNVVYFWYIASDSMESKNIYSDATLYYSVMTHCAEKGMTVADFLGGGSIEKEYGVRRFKLSLGGKLFAEYRYRKYMCL
ncbi:MAG: GNAT family N-acetyltransferase [Candidatus Aphodosoma sp.]